MTPDRWQQIEGLYHAAFNRPAPERPTFLRQACAGDAVLRREVERLEYDVAPDGRFLILRPEPTRTPSPLHVIVNWATTLTRTARFKTGG